MRVPMNNVGRRNSTLSDEGRKGWSLVEINVKGTNRGGEGGEEPAVIHM